jgi:multiple antibiotic resistance protein
MDLYGLLVAVIQLFVITDPIGNLPILQALTKKETPERRHRTFIQAVLAAFTLLIIFSVAGNLILSLFHITLPDFKIAGGILLLIIAIIILVRGSWIEEGETSHPIGVVPLGVPILVGPGAITTAMVLMSIYGAWITLLAVLINFSASFVTLYFGDRIFKLIGEEGSEIVARVMTIILAAIAIKYIHGGIIDIVQTLR